MVVEGEESETKRSPQTSSSALSALRPPPSLPSLPSLRSSMSAWEDSSWRDTPSYGPALKNPTFVKETGYQKEERRAGGSGGGEKGLEVARWYNEFASAAPSLEKISTVGGDKRYEGLNGFFLWDMDLPYRVLDELHSDPQPLVHRPSLLPPAAKPVPALPSRRTTSTLKHKTHRALDPHWFISHSVASSSSSSSVIPFSLSASTSRPPASSNLASLLTLPDPGHGPSFVPPPHFHLKAGNRGHDLLVKAGWDGRGLGKGVGGMVEGKGKGREVVVDGSDQEKKRRKPGGKEKVKKEKKLKMDGNAIDLTVSSEESSSSSSSDDDDSDSSSSSSPSTTPASSSSTPSLQPNPPSSNASVDGRFALIAPLSTTLKSDRLGIRSAASTARHTAVTHSHQQIRAAQREGREEEGRHSAKSIRKQVEKDRRERLGLMDELRGN
ncbi:hypothetical protein BDY24DRAFT_93362 [Mrakia frigida]|uniref:uncharacterized protein n=1 Tax=Mrakia frigida TaxID=29902 RepID=UPI003FCC0747